MCVFGSTSFFEGGRQRKAIPSNVNFAPIFFDSRRGFVVVPSWRTQGRVKIGRNKLKQWQFRQQKKHQSKKGHYIELACEFTAWKVKCILSQENFLPLEKLLKLPIYTGTLLQHLFYSAHFCCCGFSREEKPSVENVKQKSFACPIRTSLLLRSLYGGRGKTFLAYEDQFKREIESAFFA